MGGYQGVITAGGLLALAQSLQILYFAPGFGGFD